MKHRRHPGRFRTLILATGLSSVVLACVSETHVRQRRRALEVRVDELDAAVEQTRDRSARIEAAIDDLTTRLDEVEAESRVSVHTAEAARREAARARPERTLVTPKLLTDDSVRFPPGSAELTPRARALLELFAAEYLARNQDLYIEIRGHADGTGGEWLNRDLARRRAQRVRQYLHRRHGLPLHRMDVISYGADFPLADNSRAEGRRQNRRVTLVVRP